MDPAIAQLILLGLTLAEKVIFSVGGKLIEVNTSDLTDPEKITKALEAAREEGFPALKFVSSAQG